jgi:uncharacterized membrane protein
MVYLILFYTLCPLIILYLTWRSSVAARIGSVLIAYVAGLILGNSGLLPENSAEVQDLMTSITIPLALPLLLFSLNIRQWVKNVSDTFVSLILGIFSLIIPVFAGYFIFRGNIEEPEKVAGLLTGVYTGGTPNLASIKLALGVDEQTYILTHTYDMILSAAFLLFVMSVGQKVLLKFLRPYKHIAHDQILEEKELAKPRRRAFFQVFKKKQLLPLLAAFGISALIVAIGGGLSMIVPENSSMAVAILSITSLGIAASFLPKVNAIERTFDFGMYFILIFSVVVASMADFTHFGMAQLHLFLYISFCVLGSFIIHIILAKIFKIDADNVIIVSTALACSPPFVPVVAASLKNREIILSGLTVGIIGYAIGNYLGISIAWLLQILN